MTNSKGKSNLEIFEATRKTIVADVERYEKMKTKDGITGVKLLEKIKANKVALPTLEANKDIVVLSDSAKTYCENWVKQQLYDRQKNINSKYLQKGLVVEDNSLDFVADQLGYGVLIKNEQFFQNEFLTGTPDAILPDHLIDVKNSWDAFTFPLFDTEVPNKDYFYQAQGYMELTGRSSYKLIYTLMDTPEYLIEKEFTYNNFYELDYEQFKKDFVFTGIDEKLRIKVFEIKKDEEVIAAIKIRVAECRSYINEILKQL